MSDSHPIRLARIRAGLSVVKFAGRVGVHRSTIESIEDGRTMAPDPATLQKMDASLGLVQGTLEGRIEVWRAVQRELPPRLSNKARAVLAQPPSTLDRDYRSFAHWRAQIAPSVTHFASILGINRANVARYEQGIRENGMPQTLASAIVQRLGVSDAYLAELIQMEPNDK